MPALIPSRLPRGLTLAAVLAFLPALTASPSTPLPELQPYTRAAHEHAVGYLRHHIAILAGSRYGWVRGQRVRLDPAQLRGGAAELGPNGGVLVPGVFLSALAPPWSARPGPPPGLELLAPRWVHEWAAAADGPSAPQDFAAAARARGLAVSTHPRGLVVAGPTALDLSHLPAGWLDALVTLFDTPEQLADPAIAQRQIARLKEQGEWTEAVRTTPEQRFELAQPPIEHPVVPRANYDESGVVRTLLGSPPPPPGEYPRILFSPEDVAAIAAGLRSSRRGQMSLLELQHLFETTWWDPTTSDGHAFRLLAEGRDTEVKFEGFEDGRATLTDQSQLGRPQLLAGQKPGLFNTHVAYVPECLTTMALYCLLTGNEVRGREAAAALATWYRCREPLLDAYLQTDDATFGGPAFDGHGAVTHWRGMHALVAHMNLAFALDFGGRWMTPAERADLQRFIAKATYGRRSYGQDGPVRFRDVNWVTWDLTHFLAVCALEGLPGFDPEVYAAGRETVRAYLDWGINRHGQIWESNGKTGGGLTFQWLAMVALARRGDDFFGHPHLRRLARAQVHNTSPSGRITVSSGTFSGSALSQYFVAALTQVYPDDRAAAYLLSTPLNNVANGRVDAHSASAEMQAFEPASFLRDLRSDRRRRLPSPTVPAMTRTILFDGDWTPTDRADVGLALDWDDPEYGQFSAYSDPSADAAWIHLHVRSAHYLGAGHHHSDAGLFHFSALGVDWIAESPFHSAYEGRLHNQVLVDGVSQPGMFPARARYLGAQVGPEGSVAVADLTYAYSWRWNTQPGRSSALAWDHGPWELEPAPDILALFRGTLRQKMRPWWPTYAYSNAVPTSRAPFNPMRQVFRSVALLRGPAPYALVVDDAAKDDQVRLYEWTASLVPGVRPARLAGRQERESVLAFRPRPRGPFTAADVAEVEPRDGEPLLLVHDLSGGQPEVALVPGVPDRQGAPQSYPRLSIARQGSSARFRVLLIPFRAGQPRPSIAPTESGDGCVVDGRDEIAFTLGPDERSRLEVRRGGRIVLSTATPPAEDRLATATQ